MFGYNVKCKWKVYCVFRYLVSNVKVKAEKLSTKLTINNIKLNVNSEITFLTVIGLQVGFT